MRAADYAGLGTIVRVKGNDEHMIRNTLEFGADAVCVPHVRRAADIEQAISYAKFPPWACAVRRAMCARAITAPARSTGKPTSSRATGFADHSLAEDREFFDNIDEILAVKGVDMVNIGPLDLADVAGTGVARADGRAGGPDPLRHAAQEDGGEGHSRAVPGVADHAGTGAKARGRRCESHPAAQTT